MFFILLGAALAAPLSPVDAVTAALVSNPQIVTAEAALSSAEGAARQSAFFRENPEVEAGYGLVGERVDLSLSQPFSLSGEGRQDHKSARAEVAAAESGLKRSRLDVAASTRVAYVEAVVAHRVATFATAAFTLATRQIEGTSERVRVGDAPDLLLHLSRLEQAKAAADLLSARATEALALSRLSTLVRQPVDGEDLAVDPLDAAPEPRRQPEGERSDVVAARLAVEAAEAALRRERAAALPPLRVGVFFEKEGEAVVAGPVLGLSLPLWHQNQAGVSAAHGEAALRRADLETTRARAEAEARTAAAVNAAAITTWSSVPATEEDALAALASIEAGARSGELDLVTTILLRGEVVAGQRALTLARGDLALARIGLLLATEDPSLLGGLSP